MNNVNIIFLWGLMGILIACNPQTEEEQVATSTLEDLIESGTLTLEGDSLNVAAPLPAMPTSGVGLPRPKATEIEGLTSLTWEILRGVNFEKKYYEDEGQYFDYPTYGAEVQQLEGESVYITGYLLPINPDSNAYVLSAYTFSSCFFCGQAGPESIVELYLKEKLDDSYTTDQWIAFKGTLRLNADDLNHLYYILDDAQEVALEK